jgi:hypothetical protein
MCSTFFFENGKRTLSSTDPKKHVRAPQLGISIELLEFDPDTGLVLVGEMSSVIEVLTRLRLISHRIEVRSVVEVKIGVAPFVCKDARHAFEESTSAISSWMSHPFPTSSQITSANRRPICSTSVSTKGRDRLHRETSDRERGMTMTRNQPCPACRKLGEQFARLSEAADQEVATAASR